MNTVLCHTWVDVSKKILATRFRGDTIFKHKPSLGVRQIFPWIRKWKLQTLERESVAAELTQVATKLDSYEPIQYKARSRDNRQATDIFHGYR
jgi:hypothetical protein